MKFVLSPSRTYDAYRWFRNGDHPNDGCIEQDGNGGIDCSDHKEGLVVRYYRHPQVSGESICRRCFGRMHDHGWIDHGESGQTVCPGDWIVTEFPLRENNKYVAYSHSDFMRLFCFFASNKERLFVNV